MYADSILALVTFESIPDAAEVFLAKEETPFERDTIGLTPTSKRLEPGRYIAHIATDDLEWERPFEIRPKEERTLTATLRSKTRSEVHVYDTKFESKPSGAEIYLKDREDKDDSGERTVTSV